MNSPERTGKESPELRFHNLLNGLVRFQAGLAEINDSGNKRACQALSDAIYRLLAEDYENLRGYVTQEDSQQMARNLIEQALRAMGSKEEPAPIDSSKR